MIGSFAIRWAKISPYAFGRGVADGVGQVDRRRAGLDRGLHDLLQELHLRAAGVLGGELDVVGVLPRLLDRLDGQLDDLFLALAQLVLAVDLAGGAEDVDARACGVLDRFAGALDVLGRAAGQPADGAARSISAAIGLDRLEVARRS